MNAPSDTCASPHMQPQCRTSSSPRILCEEPPARSLDVQFASSTLQQLGWFLAHSFPPHWAFARAIWSLALSCYCLQRCQLVPFVAAFVKRLWRTGHDLGAARTLRGLLRKPNITQQEPFHTYTTVKCPQIVARSRITKYPKVWIKN